MIPYYSKAAFDLPSGPKNVESLFPSLNFSQISEYYVQLLDENDEVVVTTPVIKLCNCQDSLRLHFESYLGRFDAVNFERWKETHSSNSSEFKKLLQDGFQKTDTGTERFNIRSNKTYEAFTTRYPEEAMPWLKECADSGKGLLEWEGTQGQQDSFLPVRILDSSYEVKKLDDQFTYEFRVTFRMANDNVTIRN